MAKCRLCDIKLGFGATNIIRNTRLPASDPAYELYVCDDCLKIMKKLNAGDKETYYYIHEKIDGSKDANLKKFISNWETLPSDLLAQKEEQKRQIEEKQKEEEQKKEEFVKNFIISTTPTLEGYRIKKYLGILPISTPSSSFFDISLYAMSVNDTIKKLAMAMGGNAVVGMTYTTKREEVLGIGTVVWIEKIDEDKSE